MSQDSFLKNPRIIVIQKLYSAQMNSDQEIIFPKHRYKKFIKDVVNGTIERKELILDIIKKELKDDYNSSRTDILLTIIIMASVYELLYKLNVPKKVIINEYLSTAGFFLEDKQKKYLNAILDKLAKKIRNE